MKKSLIKSYAEKMCRELGRRVTHREAEDEIVRVMRGVARNIAPQWRFGYHTIQDIEQQAVIFALEVLNKGVYDVSRPLENFLHVHLHHQLYNFKRKHYMRLEPPCACCDAYNPPAYPCQKWLDWSERNSVKQNLMRPLDMSNISDECESDMRSEDGIIDVVVASELRTLLDRELPVGLRGDYLRMIDGQVVPKARRQKVRDAVSLIVKEGGYLDEYDAEE